MLVHRGLLPVIHVHASELEAHVAGEEIVGIPVGLFQFELVLIHVDGGVVGDERVDFTGDRQLGASHEEPVVLVVPIVFVGRGEDEVPDDSELRVEAVVEDRRLSEARESFSLHALDGLLEGARPAFRRLLDLAAQVFELPFQSLHAALVLRPHLLEGFLIGFFHLVQFLLDVLVGLALQLCGQKQPRKGEACGHGGPVEDRHGFISLMSCNG